MLPYNNLAVPCWRALTRTKQLYLAKQGYAPVIGCTHASITGPQCVYGVVYRQKAACSCNNDNTKQKKKNKQIFTLHLCTVMNARIFHTNDYEFTQMLESLHMSESSVVSLAAFLRAKTDKLTKK